MNKQQIQDTVNKQLAEETKKQPTHQPEMIKYMLGENVITARIGDNNIKSIDVSNVPMVITYGDKKVDMVYAPVLVRFKPIPESKIIT